MRLRSRLATRCVGLAALVAIASSTAVAQASTRILRGRVVLLRGSVQRALPGRWVTLHRVGPDSSGALDSVRTGASGAFSFTYRPFGDSTALYFASTQHGGIAYYAPPAHAADATPSGEITVFDTTSGLVPVLVTSRHVIVSAPETGRSRVVIELFVLTNSGDRTLVMGGSRRSTFEVPLPANATSPRVAEGDIPAAAMSFPAGVMQVSAPIAPGTKRVSFTYRVPVSAEPIQLGLGGPADFLEVLVEDSAAVVQGAGIREDAPTAVSGRTFRRFVGEKFAGAQGITVIAPTVGNTLGIGVVGVLVLLAGVAMVTVLTIALRRGSSPAADSLASASRAT